MYVRPSITGKVDIVRLNIFPKKCLQCITLILYKNSKLYMFNNVIGYICFYFYSFLLSTNFFA